MVVEVWRRLEVDDAGAGADMAESLLPSQTQKYSATMHDHGMDVRALIDSSEWIVLSKCFIPILLLRDLW